MKYIRKGDLKLGSYYLVLGLFEYSHMLDYAQFVKAPPDSLNTPENGRYPFSSKFTCGWALEDGTLEFCPFAENSESEFDGDFYVDMEKARHFEVYELTEDEYLNLIVMRAM